MMKTMFRQQTDWGGVYTDEHPSNGKAVQVVMIPDDESPTGPRGLMLVVGTFVLTTGLWVTATGTIEAMAQTESPHTAVATHTDT